MSEQFPTQPEQPEQSGQAPAHTLTPEELGAGYDLGPDETVVFDLPLAPGGASRDYDIGNGMKVFGKPVAEVAVGGATDRDSSQGLILETGATGPADQLEKQYSLVFHGSRDTQPFGMQLVKGQLWGIGRSFPGQEGLHEMASGDHCAVGLNEQGQLMVENHQPTNTTFVHGF